jgi:hypothetical protein
MEVASGCAQLLELLVLQQQLLQSFHTRLWHVRAGGCEVTLLRNAGFN